jgi:hypothetical protein
MTEYQGSSARSEAFHFIPPKDADLPSELIG